MIILSSEIICKKIDILLIILNIYAIFEAIWAGTFRRREGFMGIKLKKQLFPQLHYALSWATASIPEIQGSVPPPLTSKVKKVRHSETSNLFFMFSLSRPALVWLLCKLKSTVRT